ARSTAIHVWRRTPSPSAHSLANLPLASTTLPHPSCRARCSLALIPDKNGIRAAGTNNGLDDLDRRLPRHTVAVALGSLIVHLAEKSIDVRAGRGPIKEHEQVEAAVDRKLDAGKHV